MTEINFVAWQLPSSWTEMFLIPISDIHVGNPYFSEKHLNRTVEWIKQTENSRYVLNGDMMEAALRDSHGDIFKQTMSPEKQIEYCDEKFEDTHEQCLGVDSGNHDSRIYNRTGVDLIKSYAKSHKLPYQAEGLLMRVSFGSGYESHKTRPYTFSIYMTHGWGGARTKSAKAKKVEDQSHYITADVFIMSHDHVVNASPDIILVPDMKTYPVKNREYRQGKVTAKRVMLVKSNAYLKWGGYSQMGGYPPSDLSTPTILLMTPDSPYWKMFPERPKKAIKVIV